MLAEIICSEKERNEILEFVLTSLKRATEYLRSDESEAVGTLSDDGIGFDYPSGEIYGRTWDWIQAVADVFAEAKRKWPDSAVDGLVYAYETISCATSGLRFRCGAEDDALTVTADWQECAVCGRIIEGEAFYNSSQKDFEEGNLLCLCSPECALAYAEDEESDGVEPNAWFSDEEADDLLDSEENDDGRAFKTLLAEKVRERTEG